VTETQRVRRLQAIESNAIASAGGLIESGKIGHAALDGSKDFRA